jgi:hypothetical protein
MVPLHACRPLSLSPLLLISALPGLNFKSFFEMNL